VSFAGRSYPATPFRHSAGYVIHVELASESTSAGQEISYVLRLGAGRDNERHFVFEEKIVIPAILRVAYWVARYKRWARMRLLFILKAIVV